MDTSMLEKDALVALLDKLRELASQERGEGEILETAADDLSEAVEPTPGAEGALEAEEDESDDGSLPLFAADAKPPMRKRTGMTLGGSSAPTAPLKKGKK